jgi:hypothetical protein
MKSECWVCGCALQVPSRREERTVKTSGIGTCCELRQQPLRVCEACWREIKRNAVSTMTVKL